jgi:hypothetical protein
MSERFLEAKALFFLVSSSSSDTEHFGALACRCGCRGKYGLFKGKASPENTDGSSRNAIRDMIALVLEKKAICRERLSEERGATLSCITAGLNVQQLCFPMMLLIIQKEVCNRSDFNNFSAIWNQIDFEIMRSLFSKGL